MDLSVQFKIESHQETNLKKIVSVLRSYLVETNKDYSFFNLPTKKKKFIVLRSPHVYKKSREQFGVYTYKTLLDIKSISKNELEFIKKTLELHPAGIKHRFKIKSK